MPFVFHVKLPPAMDKDTFDKILHENWATYFRCPVETVKNAGTTLLPENKYDGDKIVALWYIGKHTFVQLDPTYFSQLEQVVKNLPAHTALTGDHIESKWSREAIVSRDLGLMHYLYPPDLPNYLPPEPFTLRQLTEADAALMSTLHAANSLEDVDEAYVEVSHQAAFGCFYGEQLVAAASGYERTGFFDLGVLTHPEFRKKGLGKAVVGAACHWAHQTGMIAQYRHNILNTNSQHVAESLNFREYFRSEGITLR
jgi:RimJ/RimL family protein N-acetyltransferase